MLGHRHRVLVVDDDRLLCEALETVLRLEGYGVATASEGQEALDRLRGGLDPCVILLDLSMPVKDGWQFRREQMEDANLARIPVIVCSGTEGTATSGLGIEDHIRKPIGFDALIGLLGRYCEREPGRTAMR